MVEFGIFGIYATYVLIGLCIALILVFSLTNLAKNAKAAKSTFIGIGSMIVLVVLAYVMSTGSDVVGNAVYEKLSITETTSHRVGTGLVAFYILGALAIASILYVEVTRLFK